MNKILYIFEESIPRHLRKLQMKRKIIRLKNTNFSIISSNCIGGVISKDFKQMHRSPTVNMFFYPKDFIKFLSNIEYYLSLDCMFDVSKEYPIGILDDIQLHFLHYDSFQNAVDKWNERKKRLNLDNLFIIMTDRDGCSKNDIEEFDRLPYKNKIIFTKEEYPEYESAVFVKHFKGKYYTSYKNILGKRYYDCFNFLDWFNGTNYRKVLKK